jgi:hypothetical protein
MKTWLTRRSLCYASTHSWLVGKCAKNGCSGTDRPLLDSPASPAGPRVRGAHLFCVARKPTPSVTRRGSSANGGKHALYHALRNRCRGLPPVADRLVRAVFGGVSFATGCHRLRPLGSTNAPPFAVDRRWPNGIRASRNVRVECSVLLFREGVTWSKEGARRDDELLLVWHPRVKVCCVSSPGI